MSDTPQAGALTVEQVRDALAGVTEPATGRTLGEAKLVSDVQVTGGTVRATIEALTPLRGMREQLTSAAREAVEAVPGVDQVELDVRTKVRASGAGRSDAQSI
ncbi:MAG: iron-sulfur cluster assembly protein, partial [Chloroflexota bacterium]|nr:iron-sulfur cluster assembly protein [Chloroflexota bacterium]